MATSGCLLAVLLLYSSINHAQPKDHSWDVLIFTQKWPTTVCNEWKHKSPTHKCVMPSAPNTWGVHGVWPTKYGTLGPFNCNSSWHFDPEAVRPIESRLSELWTNIEYGTTVYSLWAHEWTKHGTCAAILEPFNSELKYFSKGLEWVKKYNMTDILSEANIVPSASKEYPIFDIVQAIIKRLGVNPVIECRKEGGKNMIMEIRICFNKNLGLMDCDGVVTVTHRGGWSSSSILTNCDRSQGIIYPPYENEPPKKLILQLYKLVTWLQWFTL